MWLIWGVPAGYILFPAIGLGGMLALALIEGGRWPAGARWLDRIARLFGADYMNTDGVERDDDYEW